MRSLRLVFLAFALDLGACDTRAPNVPRPTAGEASGVPQNTAPSGRPAGDSVASPRLAADTDDARAQAGDKTASRVSSDSGLEATAETKQPVAVIALSGEGLQVVDRQTGASRALDFGMAQARVLETLAAMRGRPRDRSVNSECGAGPSEFASWSDGLTAWFQQARFVGWSIRRPLQGTIPEAMRGLTTAAGVGIGSTRREVDDAYDMRITQTSLGTEFDGGGLHGLLTSASVNGEVTTLWAGTACNFR